MDKSYKEFPIAPPWTLLQLKLLDLPHETRAASTNHKEDKATSQCTRDKRKMPTFGSIKLTKAPQDTSIAAGIAAIECELVVQMNGHLESPFR